MASASPGDRCIQMAHNAGIALGEQHAGLLAIAGGAPTEQHPAVCGRSPGPQ